MRFVLRLLITVFVVAFCMWLAQRHRLPSLAGLIAVMPLTGLIVLVWLYRDEAGNSALMTEYTKGALWGILPSILFFLVAFLCFRRHLPLWLVLSASFSVWLVAAIIHQWLLGR
jgi:uncharacterized membrane protein (GlpM family)